jgi:hypothetical protein
MIIHIVFLFFYFVFGSEIPTEYLIVVAIIEATLALTYQIRKNKDYVTSYTVNLVALVLVNLGNISLLHRIDTGTNYMYSFASNVDIPQAALIWCAGNSVYFIGYQVFSQKSLPKINFNFDAKAVAKIFYFIFSITLLFLTPLGSLVSALGSISKICLLAGSIGILFFARLWAAENNKTYRNYALILFFIETISAMLHAYLRAAIILPTVVFMAGYFAGLGNIKYLFTYRIIPFLIWIAMFINVFSTLGQSRSSFGTAIVNEYFSFDDDEQQVQFDDVYNEQTDRGGFLDRSASLAQGSSIVKLVKSHGFYEGAASAPLFYAFIPRFLWPDKPKVALGQWFAVEIGAGYVNDGVVNNSINMTIPAELYLDYGWLGVFIGCFLFGGFVSSLWNSTMFNDSNYNLYGAIYGGYILVMSFIGMSGDLQILITFISTYIVFLILKKITCAYFV